MDDLSILREELKRDFRNFLEQDFGAETKQGKYISQIQDILKQYPTAKKVRLEVDLQDLYDFNENLHRQALRNPIDSLPAFEDAIESVIRSHDDHSKILDEEQTFNITFTGEFGPNRVSPRALTSSLLGQLVEIRGIITRCTLVRPKIVKTVHYCATTGQTTQQEYRDVTSHRGLPTPAVYPTRDANGNLLTTQYGLSKYIDQQTITIQELPETAPPGQLPRSVEVILEGDLRDAGKPGDRVSVVGVYKPMAPNAHGSVSGTLRAVVVATGVSHLTQDASGPTFTEADYDNITDLAGEEDLMDQLAASLAPSIYGYSWIKKALILLLAGGRERTLANGTHLRGDVNCLMVGDPGVAKSQLLRAVMNIAPLCVSTTGRGSSGVGLTAAVVTDQDTGERRLEAGAMVLGDRGVVCIDEFDKMNDGDRVAIHEVMEQQTVTIAKAGILTQLNARCSVVAAANPIYGHYDRTISITRNIGLPDSLLSRFDLLFVVLDNNDATRDRDIAEHVLGQHRYRPQGTDGTAVDDDMQLDSLEDDDQKNRGETQMRVKYDARLYGPRRPGQKDPLSIPFLKKYIAFAKLRFSAPELTVEASEAIAEYYAELRNSAEVKSLPVTVRTLETIIRLACAHAKVRLSAYVEVSDVEEVQALVDLILKSDPSIGQEARRAAVAAGAREEGRAKRPRSSAGRGDDDEDDDDDDDMLDDDEDDDDNDDGGDEGLNDEEGGAGRRSTRARGTRTRRTAAAKQKATATESMDIDDDNGNAEMHAVGDNGDDNDENADKNASSSGSKSSLADAIRAVVEELGRTSSGVASVTGITSVLLAKGMKASRSDVMGVLKELESQDKIVLDGEDFYLAY